MGFVGLSVCQSMCLTLLVSLSFSSQIAAKKPFGKSDFEHALLEVPEWKILAEALPELRKAADEMNAKISDPKMEDSVTFPWSVTKILSSRYMARLNLYQVIFIMNCS